MMKNRIISILIVLSLIFTTISMFDMPFGAKRASAAPDDNIDGYQELKYDWTVTGYEEYSNETIALFGDLTIVNGGRLMLNNCTLMMMSIKLQPYSILVKNGGKMELYGCYVTDTPKDNDNDLFTAWYYFIARAGSEIIIENSTIRQCGFLDINNIEHIGISIGTNKGHIRNSTINSTVMGLSFTGNNSGFSVENLNITDVGMSAIMAMYSHGLALKNISFTNISEKSVMVMQYSDNFSVERCTLTGDQLLAFISSENIVVKNTSWVDSERSMFMMNCNNIELRDLIINRTSVWNSKIDITGSTSIVIDNVSVVDGVGIFEMDDVSDTSITNIDGVNVSMFFSIKNSEHITLSGINIDISDEFLFVQESEMITIENLDLGNSDYPIRLFTVTNLTITNMTLNDHTGRGIEIESGSDNVSISNTYIGSSLADFTMGLHASTSKVFLSNYTAHNINNSIECWYSSLVGDHVFVNGTYQGDRGIHIYYPASVHLSNVNVETQKWDGILVEYGQSSPIKMDNVYVNNTQNGILVTVTQNMTLSDFKVENSFSDMIAMSGSMVTIMNSTVGLVRADSSEITLINTTNTTGASLMNSAKLIKKWWVDVFVNDTIGPVEGAQVNIYDGGLNLEITSVTGEDGFARNIPVTEIVYTAPASAESKNPHTTTAEGPGWFAANATSYQVKGNLLVNVAYNKNAPPHSPTNLQIVSDQDSNTVLTWSPSISQDVTSYHIYIAKSLKDLLDTIIVGMPNVTVTECTYTHPGGSADWQRFWYGVKAFDKENESLEYVLSSCGNWVVNTTQPQHIENLAITLRGTLYVFGGLQMENTTLKIASQSNRDFGIDINTGSVFQAENVTIMKDESRPYYFIIRPDAIVELNGSNILSPGMDSTQTKAYKYKEGIYSMTDHLTVTNSTIQVRYGGLGIYQTTNFRGKIKNVTFQSEPMYSGEYLLNLSGSGNVDITDCKMDAYVRYGIFAKSTSDLTVVNSNIMVKGSHMVPIMFYGILVNDCENVLISDNSMLYGNPPVYILGSKEVDIEKSTFSAEEELGIFVDSSSYINVRACEFSGEEGRLDIAIHITKSSQCTVEDMYVDEISQFLIMDNCSTSSVQNVTIPNGELGISLLNCENILVNDSLITLISSGMIITGCKDIYLINMDINLSYNCVQIKSRGPVYIINSSISNGVVTDISAQGYYGELGNVYLINSTIDSLRDSYASIALNNSAVVHIINSSLNLSKLNIGDSASRAEIYHYVSIQVHDIDNNTPSWANITIFNAKDRRVYKKQANNGFAEWVFIHQKTIFKTDEYYDNPHMIYVYDGSHAGFLELDINNSGHIDVYVSNEVPWLSWVDIHGYYDQPDPQPDLTTYEPTTKFDLVLDYTYEDVEDDSEAGTIIHWYVNGVYDSKFDGMRTINAKYTSKYQTWNAWVYPSDGYDGTYPVEPYESNVLYIENTAPEVRNVTLSPATPIGGDDLQVEYDLYDIDGDGLDSAKTTHKWYYYQDSTETWVYSNIDSILLSNTYTYKGQRWRCEVTPSDGDDEGAIVTSNELVIGNTPPSVTEPVITPEEPRSNETIRVSYDYYDLDSDIEAGSTIAWFKNGEEQVLLANRRSIESERTKKGEVWYYRITPNDGEDFGEMVTSETVVIGNTAPRVANITIYPANPTTLDDLTVSYEFTDEDGDTESFDTNIQWLRKRPGDVTFAYQNLRVKTLSSIYTTKNEMWICEVTPHDNLSYGETVRAEVFVTIANSKPTVSNLEITPLTPFTGSDLGIKYDYYDLDDDAEAGFEIEWYRDNHEVSGLRNKLLVTSEYTAKGQDWYFMLHSSDGQEFSAWTKSINISIMNSPPVASDVTIIPKAPTGLDDLKTSYTYFDEDGDNESTPEIKWYENGEHRPELDGEFVVDSDLTEKGKNWYFTISVFDGSDYGEEVRSNNPEIENSPALLQSLTPSKETVKTVILNETESQIFRVTAIDPDNDFIVYYWRLDGIVVGQTNVYKFVSDYDGAMSAGTYDLELEFFDYSAQNRTFINWEIIVLNVNRPPTLTVQEPIAQTSKVIVPSSLKFSIDAYDPDPEDNLNIKWYFDGVDTGEVGSSFAYTSKSGEVGDHIVKVVVTDRDDVSGKSAQYEWNITVIEKDDKEEFLGQSYDWWGFMFAIIAGIFSVLSILFGLVRMKKKKGKLREYMNKIEEIIKSDMISGEKENKLRELKLEIKADFKKELIVENHYIILEREVDGAIGDIRTEMVDEHVTLPKELREDVEDVLEDGVVTSEEYREIMNRIRTTKDLSPIERNKLSLLLSRWMIEARKDESEKLGSEKLESKRTSKIRIKQKSDEEEDEEDILEMDDE